MIDFIRPYVARIAGSLVGALVAWLAGRWGVSVDPATQGQLTAGLGAVMLVVFGVVYSLIHRGVDAKINPIDAASVPVASISRQTYKNTTLRR